MDQTLLLTLVAGIVGAVVGAYASHRFQVGESRRLAHGATRVVFLELAENRSAIQAGLSVGPMGRVSDSAWVEERARLASYLAPEDLLTIGHAYLFTGDAQSILERARTHGQPQGSDAVLLKDIGDSVGLALNRLLPRVWTRAERERLARHAGIPLRDAEGEPKVKQEARDTH